MPFQDSIRQNILGFELLLMFMLFQTNLLVTCGCLWIMLYTKEDFCTF